MSFLGGFGFGKMMQFCFEDNVFFLLLAVDLLVLPEDLRHFGVGSAESQLFLSWEHRR